MKNYRVFFNTGTAWLYPMDATECYCEQDALDKVVDSLEDEKMDGLYWTLDEIFESAKNEGITEDEYIYQENLVCAGNHCLYVDISHIEEIE